MNRILNAPYYVHFIAHNSGTHEFAPCENLTAAIEFAHEERACGATYVDTMTRADFLVVENIIGQSDNVFYHPEIY